MATLLELNDIYQQGSPAASDLFDQIKMAVLVVAEAIRLEATSVPNHDNRYIWAKQAFHDPKAKADEMFGAILAAYNTTPASGILGATPPAIILAVANAVNIFAVGV
jgi:hypothetical protein